jgi:hypothetical protein
MQSNLSRLPYNAGILIFLLTGTCRISAQAVNPWPTIGAIPLPAGYHRIPATGASFGGWLRNIPLKKDRTVYLFNGSPKRNQDAQFAVLDIPVGRQDLQQCADAVMRLRAEWLYAAGDFGAITFYTEQGRRLNFREWLQQHPADNRRKAFDNYLTTVFTYCSTRTLRRQLLPDPNFFAIDAGEVLIRAGSPGHAMLVADVAEDDHGHRIYLLAQSYMPAQDIHIVVAPDGGLSPWYRADIPVVYTPEWIFKTNELCNWPK